MPNVARAVLVVLLLVAGLAACTVEPETPGGPGDADAASDAASGAPSDDLDAAASVPPGLDRGCPPRRTEPRFPDGGVLPEGAVAVRMCEGILFSDGRMISVPFDPPDDLVTHDVDTLVDVVNGLDAGPTAWPCSTDGGPAGVLWFLYPGGEARAVSASARGCDRVIVAPGELREGGRRVFRAFVDALMAQRAVEEPPGTSEVLHCNPFDTTFTPLLARVEWEFTSLTLCLIDAEDGTSVREAVLGPDLVEQMSRALRARRPEDMRCEAKYASMMLRGTTTWGDRVQLYGRCFSFVIPWDWRHKRYVGPGLARALRNLQFGPVEAQCFSYSLSHLPGSPWCGDRS